MKITEYLGKGKCPKCEKGVVFNSIGNVLKLKMPKMNECCSNCGYLFEKEPGYFLGAFYVSYGMTVGELSIIYFITHYFIENVWVIISVMLIGLLLMSCFNFRVARLIWIYTFNK
jgi:uncharacterized protein (DUF983 family)